MSKPITRPPAADLPRVDDTVRLVQLDDLELYVRVTEVCAPPDALPELVVAHYDRPRRFRLDGVGDWREVPLAPGGPRPARRRARLVVPARVLP